MKLESNHRARTLFVEQDQSSQNSFPGVEYEPIRVIQVFLEERARATTAKIQMETPAKTWGDTANIDRDFQCSGSIVTICAPEQPHRDTWSGPGPAASCLPDDLEQCHYISSCFGNSFHQRSKAEWILVFSSIYSRFFNHQNEAEQRTLP